VVEDISFLKFKISCPHLVDDYNDRNQNGDRGCNDNLSGEMIRKIAFYKRLQVRWQ
jgi:hypothetical protein